MGTESRRLPAEPTAEAAHRNLYSRGAAWIGVLGQFIGAPIRTALPPGGQSYRHQSLQPAAADHSRRRVSRVVGAEPGGYPRVVRRAVWEPGVGTAGDRSQRAGI